MTDTVDTAGPMGDDALTPAGVTDLLDANLTLFERLVADRTREELAQPGQDGGWGVVDILSHLRDWEEITHDRVWRILDGDMPALEEHDDAFWAIENEYGARDGHQVLGETIAMRHQLIDRLRGLDPAGWERAGDLEGTGPVTVLWLMRTLARHDAKNLARMREALG
jgi:hypothetical protein